TLSRKEFMLASPSMVARPWDHTALGSLFPNHAGTTASGGSLARKRRCRPLHARRYSCLRPVHDAARAKLLDLGSAIPHLREDLLRVLAQAAGRSAQDPGRFGKPDQVADIAPPARLGIDKLHHPPAMQVLVVLEELVAVAGGARKLARNAVGLEGAEPLF